jgi:hypothetical protein
MSLWKCNECYAESYDGKTHYSSCPSRFRNDDLQHEILKVLRDVLAELKLITAKIKGEG